MKTILKPLLITVILITSIQNTQAQFLKKLKERAKEKIEQEAERRAQRRVDKKIDKAFDKTEDVLDGKPLNKTKSKNGKNNDAANTNTKASQESKTQNKSISTSSKSYNFEWKYTLKMDSKAMRKKANGAMNISYYLSPNTSAFASKFEVSGQKEMNNMIMLMDPILGTNLMLMEMDGQKIKQKMPSFSAQDTGDLTEEQAVKDYTIVKTDTKTILGYACQGFKVTSNEGVVNMYIAKNAPISFSSVLAGNTQSKPKGFNPKWLKEFKNGLMMEMQFTSNKKEKYNMKMTCVELVREPLSINLNEYKSFMNAK